MLDSLKEKYSAPSIAVDDLLFAIRKDINLNSAGIEKRNNRFFNFMHSFVVSYRMYPQIESQGIDPWIIENGTAKYRFIQQTTNW